MTKLEIILLLALAVGVCVWIGCARQKPKPTLDPNSPESIQQSADTVNRLKDQLRNERK